MTRRDPEVRSILVVEAYPDLRAAIAAAVQREHFRCDAVSSSDEARLLLRGNDYAYVILDVDDAPDVERLADALAERTHLIVISDQYLVPSAGCDRLRKPFSRDELVRKLET